MTSTGVVHKMNLTPSSPNMALDAVKAAADMRIGQILLSRGRLTAVQVSAILEEQTKFSSQRFGEIAVRMGLVKAKDIDDALALQFGYTALEKGGNQRGLRGRRMITFTSSGAPQEWVERSGAWAAMQTHFDEHFAAVTGLEIIGHHNVGGVGGGMRKDVVDRHRQAVADRARQIIAAGPRE